MNLLHYLFLTLSKYSENLLLVGFCLLLMRKEFVQCENEQVKERHENKNSNHPNP